MNNTLLFWNLVGWSAAAVVFELIRRQLWAKPNRELLELMNKALLKPWRQTPLAADIPRLARKIAIHLPTRTLARKDGSSRNFSDLTLERAIILAYENSFVTHSCTDVVPAMEQLFVALTDHFEVRPWISRDGSQRRIHIRYFGATF